MAYALVPDLVEHIPIYRGMTKNRSVLAQFKKRKYMHLLNRLNEK